ncbi:MAG: tyrosine-protein phosphatase [Prevotella sp.]
MFFGKKKLSETGIFNGLTDCHSHLLPDVDDGVKTIEDTLHILDILEEQGVMRLWLTPHIMEDIPNTTNHLKEVYQSVKNAYKGNIELFLAAEYMLDNLFLQRLAADDLLPLRQERDFLLVETSYFSSPMNLHSILERIMKKGYYPMLAHPERYEYMSMSDYSELKSMNIHFQLNIPALVGSYGPHVQSKAEMLLKKGYYDICGNDIHSLNSILHTLGSSISKSVARRCMEIGKK